MKVRDIFEIASEEDFAKMQARGDEQRKKLDDLESKLKQAKGRAQGDNFDNRRSRRRSARRRGTEAPSRVSAFGM